MHETFTPDAIRHDKHFMNDIQREPLASMDEFIARLPATEFDIFTALQEMCDYRADLIKEEAKRLIDLHGSAVGIELSATNGRLSVVFPNTRPSGGYRLAQYDEHGPSTHEDFADPIAAVVSAVKDGYRELSPGRLDALTDLPTWRRGVNWALLLMRSNGNPYQFLNDNPGYLDA